MRVLVVDESAERAELVGEVLLRAGYQVTATLSSPVALLKTIDELAPDVIVIDTESPSRDVLEHLVVMSRHTPRPVVMFSADGDPETIRAATRAGVSAYVVHGISAEKIHPIVNAAIARFDELQQLREQLAEANLRLDERKLVERAKGILMKARSLDEDGAYRALRRMAMDKNKRIGEVARSVIEMVDFLG
jgi:two-component system, response regulator / RNA-binding antiterminator